MASDLIRQYISLLLEIRHQTSPGVKTKFSFADLKRICKLKSYYGPSIYAGARLKKLGEGSSRAAFLLTSKRVLKTAVNKTGADQNEAEVEIYTNPKTKGVVTKIYDYDPNFKWIVSELVSELRMDQSSLNSFWKGTGMGWSRFVKILDDRYDYPVRFKTCDRHGEPYGKFMQTVINLLDANDLTYGDLQKINHWGKTSDDRIVLLDFGLTKKVWEDHYDRPKWEALT